MTNLFGEQLTKLLARQFVVFYWPDKHLYLRPVLNVESTGLHILLVTFSWIALAGEFNGLYLNSELLLLAQISFLSSKSLQSQMSMDTCVEAGMASDFQSASQSAVCQSGKGLEVCKCWYWKKPKAPIKQSKKTPTILCSLWAKPLSIFDGHYKRPIAEMLYGFEFFLQ